MNPDVPGNMDPDVPGNIKHTYSINCEVHTPKVRRQVIHAETREPENLQEIQNNRTNP